MPGAAGGDRVGELGEAVAARQRHALDLQIAGGRAGPFQHEVDAAVGAVADFAPEAVVAGELWNAAGRQGIADQGVVPPGIDADEAAGAAILLLSEEPPS